MYKRVDFSMEPKAGCTVEQVDEALIIAARAYAACRTGKVSSLDEAKNRYIHFKSTLMTLREFTVEQDMGRLDNAAGMRSDRLEAYPG